MRHGTPRLVTKVNENPSILTMKAEISSKEFRGMTVRSTIKTKMSETPETVLMDAKAYAGTGEISVAQTERITVLERNPTKRAVKLNRNVAI